MASEALPPAVAALIGRYIRSVEQLEVLLLLHGQPQRFWTSDEVYDVIRSSRSSVMQRLENFAAEEFLEVEEGAPRRFRYAPKSAELRSAVDTTAAVYQTWRIRVIEAIFAPADPVQSFADAFKFRKN